MLTVGRVNDNTLRVRIGARMTSATSSKAGFLSPAKQSENYRAIAQTHNVSLLVLLPASTVVSHPANVYFGTHTKFVDVRSGNTFDDSSMSEASAASALDQRFGEDYKALYKGDASAKPNSSDLSVVAAAAQNSDYATFVDTLSSRG